MSEKEEREECFKATLATVTLISETLEINKVSEYAGVVAMMNLIAMVGKNKSIPIEKLLETMRVVYDNITEK